FFCSTLNASLIALAERRGEAGTLLTLGHSRWWVGSLFLREGLVVGLTGTLLGLLGGYLVFRGMSFLFATELLRLPVVFPPSIWVWTVTLGLFFNLIAYGLV